MSSDGAEVMGFFPYLPEHWENNSLLGSYAAIGRFNLCRAYDVAKHIEQPLQAMQPRRPPSTTHLLEFMSWVAKLEVATEEVLHPLLRRVIAKARQDLAEVPLDWWRHHIVWCPACMKLDHHKAIHQHRALWFCPVHHVRLEQFCRACGQHNGYRVLWDCEPFICRCGSRIDGAPEQTPWPRALREAPSLDTRLTCRVAEQVWVAGLPWNASPPPPLGISPNDVRIYFAESMRSATRSLQSRVLGRYFRFLRPSEIPRRSNCTHDEAISRIAAHVRTVAMLSGHACIGELAGPSLERTYLCPCHAGFSLWLQRSRSRRLQHAPWSKHVNLMTYEGSHLGVCLSVCWLAHVQAQLMDQDCAAQMVEAFWDVPDEAGLPSPADEKIPNTRAFVSHTFQWMAIRCRHVSGQVTRMGERLAALGGRSLPHAQDDVLADARWIMDQLGASARR